MNEPSTIYVLFRCSSPDNGEVYKEAVSAWSTRGKAVEAQVLLQSEVEPDDPYYFIQSLVLDGPEI